MSLQMNLTIISVGKLKEKYSKMGITEYRKRLSTYSNLNLIEVQDKKAPENLFQQAEMDLIKRKEGKRISVKILADTFVVTLEIKGKQLSSEQLADQLDRLATQGRSKV